MTRRRSIIGALVLCALSLCAFGAANASAKGMTAVTCVEGKGTPEFNNSHCESELVGGGWITQDIPLNETTEVEGASVTPTTNALQSQLAGLSVIVTCEMADVTGHVKNITIGEVMFAHGTNIVIDYTECHAVLASNPEKTCTVTDKATGNVGTIKTLPLTSITSETEHEATFKPESEEAGAPFARFTVNASGGTCFTKVAVEEVVTGQVTGKLPTAKPSHVTFEGTGGGKLLANGQVASYMGTNNAWMKGQPEHTIAVETR